jgi:hypothetical protein
MWHKRMAFFLTSKFPVSCLRTPKYVNFSLLPCKYLWYLWLLKWYTSIAVYSLGVLWIVTWNTVLIAWAGFYFLIECHFSFVTFIWNLHPWWRMSTSSTECHNFTQDALACSMATLVHTLIPSHMININ